MGEAAAKPDIGGKGSTVGLIGVRRVGERAWILRSREALEGDAVDALRDAFLDAVDAGAQNVAIDLSAADMIAPSGAETILAMADLMRGRGATLWLAARRSVGEYALRAIKEEGRSALLGLSPELDAAFNGLPPTDASSDLRKPAHAADRPAIDPGEPARGCS